MFSYIWPLVLVVLSNTVYQVCAKEVPDKMNPFASYYFQTSHSSFGFSNFINNPSVLIHRLFLCRRRGCRLPDSLN